MMSFLSGQGPMKCNLIVLLVTGGTFKSYPFIREMLEKAPLPLVVLSDQFMRGQIYAALRGRQSDGEPQRRPA